MDKFDEHGRLTRKAQAAINEKTLQQKAEEKVGTVRKRAFSPIPHDDIDQG